MKQLLTQLQSLVEIAAPIFYYWSFMSIRYDKATGEIFVFYDEEENGTFSYFAYRTTKDSLRKYINGEIGEFELQMLSDEFIVIDTDGNFSNLSLKLFTKESLPDEYKEPYERFYQPKYGKGHESLVNFVNN